MNTRRFILVASSASALACASLSVANAAADTSMSDADKAFVAKVSQGGMFEVALGTLASKQGGVQDIRDQGATEEHDHDLVGNKLKSIVQAAGMSFPAELNAEFKARLAKVSALSGRPFDVAYIEDMQAIHKADGAAFLEEAEHGKNPDLKSFAAETFNIVQRHLGEINAKTRPQM